MGPRSGDVERISGDPKGWLAGQIDTGPEMPSAFRGLAPSGEHAVAFLDAVYVSVAELVSKIGGEFRQVYRQEAKARMTAAIDSPHPFHERLVWFWANHFTVSARRAIVIGLAGGYEREAIRPHVTGRFEDLLTAAVSHPAMLLYLDNANSVGGGSRRGAYLGRGLNENLAREILELHTVGVDAGYTQDDVRELAKILTGWTFSGRSGSPPGAFVFTGGSHEPGSKTLLGEQYLENGVEEGRAALRRLAKHPATARHIAGKMARHFIADDPPASVVNRLESVFLETDGDLKQLALALIEMPEAWDPTLRKVKSPQEYVVAVLRAAGGDHDPDEVLATLESFGHLPFMAPSPAGWPDSTDAWITPDAMLRRARWCAEVARRHAGRIDAGTVMRDAIGPLAQAATRQAVEQAGDNEEALALMFASPTFQRR